MIFLVIALIELPLMIWCIYRVFPKLLVQDSRLPPDEAHRTLRRSQLLTLVIAGGFTELLWILLALFYPT